MGQDDLVTTIEPWLRDILRCPSCKGVLRDGTDPDAGGAAELHCTVCRLAYRIDDAGIPVLLVDEARTRD